MTIWICDLGYIKKFTLPSVVKLIMISTFKVHGIWKFEYLKNELRLLPSSKKILESCLKGYIFRSYHFSAKITLSYFNFLFFKFSLKQCCLRYCFSLQKSRNVTLKGLHINCTLNYFGLIKHAKLPNILGLMKTHKKLFKFLKGGWERLKIV